MNWEQGLGMKFSSIVYAHVFKVSATRHKISPAGLVPPKVNFENKFHAHEQYSTVYVHNNTIITIVID